MNNKGYDLVARRHRWLTRFVDQMNGHDAVGAPHILSNERRYVGVGSAIGQLPSDEAIAERFCVGRKALRPAKFITFEAIGENREVLSFKPLANSRQFLATDLQTGAILERERGL
jgi:hypothetical protein